METALLLIPETNDMVNKESYLTDCIEVVMKEDFMPFCPDIYQRYIGLDYDEYIKKILPLIKAIFLFIDFGIDERMFNVIDIADKEKLVYKRTLKVDLNKYMNSLPKILKDVSDRTRIPIMELQSKTRRREVVDARFIYYRRARKYTKESLRNIGLPVGKDHATVLHGIKEAENTREVVCLYQKLYG